MTSDSERLGGVLDELAVCAADGATDAADGLGDRAAREFTTVAPAVAVASPAAAVLGSAPATVEAGVARTDAVDAAGVAVFPALVPRLPDAAAAVDAALRSGFSAFEPRAERVVAVGPADLAADDDTEPVADESAWAIPVAPVMGAQTPAARAPVPSHSVTLLGGCCARWRPNARRAAPWAGFVARCLAAICSLKSAFALSVVS